jgi:hypothetical protein
MNPLAPSIGPAPREFAHPVERIEDNNQISSCRRQSATVYYRSCYTQITLLFQVRQQATVCFVTNKMRYILLWLERFKKVLDMNKLGLR